MKRFCLYPFKRVHFSATGDVYVCCSAWMGLSLGNIFESDFNDIWNSDKAKSIRQTIFDGSFRYCKHDVCPRIISGQVENEIIPDELKPMVENKQGRLDRGPEHLSLNYDKSCNLHCKSCRVRVNVMDKDRTQRIIQFQDSLLASDLFQGARRVVVTGAGEPFASKIFMDFFQKIDETRHPRLRITLRTNGILLTPARWEQIKNAHFAIDAILISMDAATEKTYQKLREGADFKQLLKNLEFLEELKKTKKFKLGLNFVVQEENFKEMPRFLRLARRFHCDEVTFTQLMNLGTYSAEEYNRLAIHKPGHPQYRKLKKIIGKTVFKDPIVSFNNLSHLFD